MPNISDSVLGCAGSSELRNLDIFCFFQHSTVFIWNSYCCLFSIALLFTLLPPPLLFTSIYSIPHAICYLTRLNSTTVLQLSCL